MQTTTANISSIFKSNKRMNCSNNNNANESSEVANDNDIDSCSDDYEASKDTIDLITVRTSNQLQSKQRPNYVC